jgi:hypothetical protein
MPDKEPINLLESLIPVNSLPPQLEARAGYRRLFDDDEELLRKSVEVFNAPLRVFGETMSFIYELLIIVYDNVDKWENDQQRRFVHASIGTAFNSLILTQSNVLRGYFFEGQLVLRTAQEWLAKSMLFHEDSASVDEFIDKGRIADRTVRDRLEAIYDARQPGAGSQTAKMFRQMYSRRSEWGHASFQALAMKTFQRAPIAKTKTQHLEISKTIGRGMVFGGYSTREVGYAAMIDLMSTAEAMLQISVAQIGGDTGDLKRRHELIRSAVIQQVSDLRTEITTKSTKG